MARINTGRNPGGGEPWAPFPPRTGPAGRWFGPGNAVGEQSLSGAIGQLNFEHPLHVQGERLQNTGTRGIHRPVQSSTYGGRVNY